MGLFRSAAALVASLLAIASVADSATVIQFQIPKSGATTSSSSVVVPNDFIFDELDELEADLLGDFRSLLEGVRGLTLRSLHFDFATPTALLSGSGQSVTASLSGIEKVSLSIRYKSSDFLVNLLCGTVSASVAIEDLLLSAEYNFYTGSVGNFKAEFTDIDVDVGCSSIIGKIVTGLNDIFNIVDLEKLAEKFVQGSLSSLNGRFENLFSLSDALQGAQESGLREIRQTTQDALMTLGGVRSAVACFIANHITEELIVRLGLRTEQAIDELRRRLEDLPRFIGENLPVETSFVNGAVVGEALEAFLLANLPNIQQFLLDELDALFDVSVEIIRDIERVAVEALCDIVKVDFSSLFGGVNARLRLFRSSKKVVFDAFHDGPSSFIGRAEAVAPCLPTYTIPPVENAALYNAYNSQGTALYSESSPTSSLMSAGLLRHAQVRNNWGLYSYGTSGTVELFAFQDCGCTRETFRWPQCPIAGVPAPRPAPVSRPVPRPIPAPVPIPFFQPTRPGYDIP